MHVLCLGTRGPEPYKLDKKDVDKWLSEPNPIDESVNSAHLDELGGAGHLSSVRLMNSC